MVGWISVSILRLEKDVVYINSGNATCSSVLRYKL